VCALFAVSAAAVGSENASLLLDTSGPGFFVCWWLGAQ
jgi:hypothetical protein